MFSDGYLYLCGAPGVMNISKNAMTPIRPMNMSTITTNCAPTDNDCVKSIDRPTVLNADIDSKNNLIVSTSGISNFNTIVLINTAPIDNAIVANAFCTDDCDILLPNISIESLPNSTLRKLSMHTANVVTFIPPPVDIGAHPIQNSNINTTNDAPDAIDKSAYMNPAVLADADKNNESTALSTNPSPDCVLPASSIMNNTAPNTNSIKCE